MTVPAPILVVDDHPLVRDALAGALAAPDTPWRCVTAAGVAEALALLQRGERYAAVLADQRLPDGDGLALLLQVATTQPSAARVLMSGADHTRLAQRARQQGLSGYLSKRMDAPAIVAALKHMLRGERFFADEDDGGGAAASIQLTARQTEVLQWVCEGRSSKEIARTLGVAERTVKDHLTLIYVRLGVRGRAEAVARAGALGLIRLEA